MIEEENEVLSKRIVSFMTEIAEILLRVAKRGSQ